MSASDVALFSLNQRDADIGVRERFAEALAGADGSDRLVLLTCHRAEVLIADPSDRDLLSARLGTELPAAGHLRSGKDAVRQLLRVVCGLDSAVRGEAQILGQLRRAYEAARGEGLDPVLALVVRRALETGRELRRTTPLGSVRRTLGSLAVDAALAGLPAPTTATVLVIGAGEVGKLALRALGSRTGDVIVANRDAARGEAVAAEHGGRAIPLDQLEDALATADVVIAAADTRGTVLTVPRLTARLAHGPLTIVDLAVPRSVPSEARALDGLRYVDVDRLAAGAGSELDRGERCGHGHHRRLAHDPAALTDLLVRRVEPDVWVGLVQRAVTELSELLVEQRADAAHLAAADAAATQRRHEVIDLACADGTHVCLLDHRKKGSVDAPTRFEQRREEAARAQLGDLQLEPARPGVEDPLSMAIAVRGAGRCALMRLGTDVGRCLSLDEPLHGVLENAPEQVGVGAVEVVE